MDLVVGATGQLGGRIASGLQARGRRVRALVRDPAAERSAALAGSGIDLAAGDLRLPLSLIAALDGVDTVVCTATTMPHGADDGLRRVDRDGVLALVEAAARSGVRRFVYVSYSGGIETPSPLHEAKRGVEARLRESPMETCALRPSFFMQAWLTPRLGFDPAAGKARVFGAGDAPVRFVSIADVAAFGVAAAASADRPPECIEIGGPEALTPRDVIRRAETRTGRVLEVEQVPLEALRQQHAGPDPLQRSFAALMLALAAGDPVPGAEAGARTMGVTLTPLDDHLDALLATPAAGPPG